MSEILERFLECAKEYFDNLYINETSSTHITFALHDVDEDYALESLQSICENLAAEFEIETLLDPNLAPFYLFSYSALNE
jgi:hypothetical protein